MASKDVLQGEYIFMYLLRECPELIESTVAMTEATGMKVAYISENNLISQIQLTCLALALKSSFLLSHTQTSSLPIPFMQLYSLFSSISPSVYMQQISLVRVCATCWAISGCLTVASTLCVPTMFPLVTGVMWTLFLILCVSIRGLILERRFRNGRDKPTYQKYRHYRSWRHGNKARVVSSASALYIGSFHC